MPGRFALTSDEVTSADRAGGVGDVEQQVVGVEEAVDRQVDRQVPAQGRPPECG
jgi:hypothetical protein